MIDVVLHEPEIPMNTGNIARTCACTGASLHLIKPLFDVSDRAVKRAGLDYWQYVDVHVYDTIEDYFAERGDGNVWLATTKAPRSYAEADFTAPDIQLLFGKETAGLPEWLRERYRDRCIRIPMIGPVRSLNLANSAAILIYEALRQRNFEGLVGTGSMKENLQCAMCN